MIAEDCVAQRHLVVREPTQPYRPCPNYCECWCHDIGRQDDPMT